MFLLFYMASAGIFPLPPLRHPVTRFPQLAARPGSANCSTHWFEQRIDHFSPQLPPSGVSTYKQRYFVCGAEYRTSMDDPIFFYVGNEADVTLYVNATGLMWESAPAFHATMVFAEHRYFGASLPFGAATSQHMQYLSTEQALADYATLIFALRAGTGGTPALPHGAPQAAAFIGFGGSYGGMLGSWLRMKFPSALDGMIAGSAPIESFLGETPPYDTGSYAKGVTLDASVAGGAAAGCAEAVSAAWGAISRLGTTAAGRRSLETTFRLCPASRPLEEHNTTSVSFWAQSAMDYMAMGSYPYPSSYILNGALDGRIRNVAFADAARIYPAWRLD